LNPFILHKNDDSHEEYLIKIQTNEETIRKSTAMIYFIINKADNTTSLKPHFSSACVGDKLSKELNNKTKFHNTLRAEIEKYQSVFKEEINSPNTNELRLQFDSEKPLEIDTESGSKNDSKPNKLILYNRGNAEGKFHFESKELAKD
jgi:hypothetical protein